MTHDPTRDCEHGRLKGKCDVCDLRAEAEADKTIIEYHEATIERLTDLLNKAQPDYAWPTIADYEKEVGFEVNDAFKAAWTMARTTNDLFKQMGETK
jgi:hypothetical protein